MGDRTVTFVIFFEGTANTLSPVTTQIGLFARSCSAASIKTVNIASLFDGAVESDIMVKIAFDGCGVTHGIGGVLLARGLSEQCAEVVAYVGELLEVAQRVRCVVLGLSRGGIACAKLAKDLSATEVLREKVDVSMLMFDPVPGNSLWFGIPYTGTKCSDLTSCTNLRDVLAVYPHEPLPALAFHGPKLYVYPSTCSVVEDVTLGCHQGALFGTSPVRERELATMVQDRGGHMTCTLASNLSFRRILDWFEERRVSFNFDGQAYVPSKEDCIAISRAALQADWPTQRALFDSTGQNRTITRHSIGPYTRLNRHHADLEPKSTAEEEGRSSYLLEIEST